MTDPEYMDRAEAALAAIERSCDRINDESDVDIDNQRVGGMITIIFGNGSQLIVNLQKPLQEIWLAARSGGYHYRHDGRAWVDTKTGEEFFDNLSREATRQSGQPLQFIAG
ncbi:MULTISPECIES: iron donor protein CyaY [Variovorax]|jgi:CyaY protein|uniref:Iron-sulfur cluster assembly protein CyaY n=1 Tax=Variovorax ginsengisoli TaxID=363844 RepID=A0ABT8RXB7_9BURK|nr:MULTISPECIES: iron donor protein CyaY [Variovorax]MDM0083822.1 iron donor protein CyaY [Variovorax sp. J31P179]MDN8611815.1 iron donor protein CyaY [Variovorax ginsengisoli]MDO1530985.1 iron donor protein CyaY [Variovorax ginsengisoli]HET7837979.1 iron donor protein CyaY [Variovorax sp.]